MSGSPVNIQRDATWINPKTADDLAWSTQSLMTAGFVTANAKTTVHEDAGNAHTWSVATVAVDNQECIGLYFRAPDGDNSPYRVKAAFKALGVDADLAVGNSIVVGYAPASITGTDDDIEDVFYLPFHRSFDDIIMVPTLESGDTYFGRAIFFGVTCEAGLAGVAFRTRAHISVQRLAIKPPTMQCSVS